MPRRVDDRAFDALMEEHRRLWRVRRLRGARRPGVAHALPLEPRARTLRTDGPYAESKEQLAGFFLIDCESRERAEEIAAHVRPARAT